MTVLDGDEDEGSDLFIGMFLWLMVKSRLRGDKAHTATLRSALPLGLGRSWMALSRAAQFWSSDTTAQGARWID
jgi:hypothetical protein